MCNGRRKTIGKYTKENSRIWITCSLHSQSIPGLVFVLSRARVNILTDCALCETGYSPSLSHTCTQCSSSRRQGTIAAVVIAAIIAAVLSVVTSFNLLLSTEVEERNTGWFHRRVLEAVPVQALKIIVVVWQILTQVWCNIVMS